MYTVLLVIHTLIAIGIVGAVLLQRSESDGFGLSGGGNSVLSGQAKANFMTRATSILAALLMISSLTLTVMLNRNRSDSIMDRIETQAVGAEPATGETPAAGQQPTTPDAAPTEVPLAE